MSFFSDIKMDAAANSHGVLYLLFTHPGFQMLFFYRLERSLRRLGAPGRVLGRMFRCLSVVLTACHVSPLAKIAPGIAVPHATGIIIGYGVEIETGVRIYQQVTLGLAKLGVDKFPKVGSGTILYAGSKILGGITIGKNVLVGANSVVLIDVPDNAVVTGLPARIVSKG